MKTFQDLYIHLNGFEMEALVDLFTKQCNEYWMRAIDREKKSESLGEKAYCFEHSESGGLRNAGLTLFEKSHDVWYVPNIVPIESGQLSYDEYNNLLTDFTNSIVKPVIEDLPVSIELTKDQIFLEDITGEEIAGLLKKFSALANKSTGSSHPLDKKRWFAFIYAVNKAEATVHTDILERTLVEQGWSEESSNELAIEFEFAQDLLNYAKGE
jgi:hypothetical protein